MIITQLIYIQPGQEKIFDEFEAVAIPLISKYNGDLLLRVRPGKDALIAGSMECPYEIHVVAFPVESDFNRFMKDETRRNFMHLKEKAIRSPIMIKGDQMA
jgi:hypothetical protein